MSTRVRIYELSRELDLENKDILSICEQLNIAVKSHSSTITEAQANSIRGAAPDHKPAASASQTNTNGSVPTETESKAHESKASESKAHESKAHESKAPHSPKAKPKVKEKAQKIVAIRKNEADKGPTSSAASIESSPPAILKPKVAPKPTRPSQSPPSSVPEASTHQASTSRTPVSSATPPKKEESPIASTPQLKNKPVQVIPKAKAAAMSSATQDVHLQEPKSDALSASKSSDSKSSASKSVDSETSSVGSPAKPTVKPSVKPPMRPPAPKVEKSPALLHKPKLARPKVTAESLVSVQSGGGRLKPTGSDFQAASGDREDGQSVIKAPPQLRDKPRQIKPVRAGGAPKPKDILAPDVDSDADVVAIKPKPMLDDSPKLHHKPKRTSRRGQVDEDPDELKLKAQPKPKRRGPKPMVEDDDLFGDEPSAQQTTIVDVSQSLVRPPKPNAGRQAKPASTPSFKTGGSSRGGSRRNRRDRQQKEVVIERPTTITLSADLTVKELALQLMVPEIEIIKNLFMKGIAANINQTLDLKTATIVAEEFEVLVETTEAESEARKLTEMLDVADMDKLSRRPPVVTIMGHVDHGKTTLLDAIRETKVAQGEAGGITQHIGAYHVDLEHNGQKQQVVFLDTPGHEAFTAMRARGARVTDIAILVVAADDGVRPQTLEAMRHAQAAEVPIIVAINKMDKEGAQPDRVKQELSEHNLVPEEWGGETIMCPVSALKGENLDALLEMILLVAEVEDLQANPDRFAKGTVIEAHLDKARGPVASLLVQNGTLRVGDVIVAGAVFGKVKAMVDDRGDRVESASPSFAVEILGMNEVPAAGDEFDVYADEKEARAIADARATADRQTRLMQSMGARRVSLGSLSEQVMEGELKELNVILKTDVQGSVEAILSALGQLPQKEVQLRTLLAAPGEITETDVDLASASRAVILGFNTSLASGARQAADEAGVDIRDYSVIYKLLEDIEGAMEGLLDPELVETPLGTAEVRAVFPSGRGAVAGCYIQNGKLQRNCRVRVHRGSELVFEGSLDSLKRMKEDVREVNTGYECGVGIDNFSTWKEGDSIEAFQMVTKRRSLSH